MGDSTRTILFRELSKELNRLEGLGVTQEDGWHLLDALVLAIREVDRIERATRRASPVTP